VQLGQVQQCHGLTLTLEKIFRERNDERSFIQCTSLLGRIAMMNGKYEEVVDNSGARRTDIEGNV
jgi:hypothetical protein